MNKQKTVAGIELGSGKIATVIALIKQDESGYEKSIDVIGASSVTSAGIKKGQIVNIDEAVETTVASIDSAERMAGINLTSAYISLGGAHIHSQNSHGVVAVSGQNNEISESDVDRVIDAASAISLPENREVIHVLPREYMVDGESGIKNPIDMSGVRLEVDTHVVTGSGAAIKNLNRVLSEADVHIEDIVFSGLASAQSTLSATEKELGCVLVDIGAGTTSVAAFTDGSLAYSGVIPIGARNVTSDIAIGMKVSLETAEKIKLSLSHRETKKDSQNSDEIDLGSLGITEIRKASKKTLTEGIVRPRLNEIFTMVRLELEREKLINRVPSGVIITGGGAKTVSAEDSAKRMLSLSVRTGMPSGVKGLVDDIIDPSFSNVLGLLIYGSKQNSEEKEGFRLPGKLKIPRASFGTFGKFIDYIKDLLP